ncbi:MAG: DUF1772 domain-containing protein [Actinomycetota bacterium]
MQILETGSILLAALVFGIYWGPWVALSRSFGGFDGATFLRVVHQMDHNLGTLMTVLTPITLLAIAADAVLTAGPFAYIALALFVVTLIVTIAIEVPVVTKLRGDTLPDGWEALRDRWIRFHLARVIPGFLGLGFLVAAAIF